MRAFILFACLTGFATPAPAHAAGVQGFDGITIIALADEAAGQALTGDALGTKEMLVTYVSPRGTYASVGPWDQRGGERRLCVAWARDDGQSSNSIAFGLPADEQSVKLVHPPICQPFRLTLRDSDSVRLEVAGKFERIGGPVDSRAKPVEYDQEQRIVARIASAEIDWSLPAFSHFAIKGVRLGPTSEVRKSLPATATFHLSPLERTTQGSYKILSATIYDTPDRSESTTVFGRVAAAATLGSASDIFYAVQSVIHLRQRSLTDVFEKAAAERYGPPSMSLPSATMPGRDLYWLVDLKGRTITRDVEALDNCLSTKGDWIGSIGLTSNLDIGAFGCSLVMVVSHDGDGGTVGQYSITIVSGYIAALNHFATRLDEVADKRRKIEAVQSFQPKL